MLFFFFLLTFRLFSQEHVNVCMHACDTCTTVDVLIDPVLIKMHFKKVINEFIFSQQKRVNLLWIQINHRTTKLKTLLRTIRCDVAEMLFWHAKLVSYSVEMATPVVLSMNLYNFSMEVTKWIKVNQLMLKKQAMINWYSR